jgi:hypothetical protein
MGKGLKEFAQEAWADAFGVACAVGDAVVDAATGFDVGVMGHVANTLQTGLGVKDGLGKNQMGTNPYFITHKVDELDVADHSPKTAKYFKMRRIKKIGGSVFSGVGAALGIVTQVNALGIARHGRAEASTLTHLYRFHAMSKQVKQSQYLSQLISVMIKAKGVKAGARGAQLAADCIPEVLAGGAIIAGVVGGVSSVAASTAMKKMSGMIALTSIELQWRAYQELKVGRAFGGGTGPAYRMVAELLNSPVLDKVKPLAGVHPSVYIVEPFGHLVIRDKLMLV